MAESILKIHTQNGDIPVGYPGLANKPIADKTLSVEGAFADSKVVGDRFKEVNAETDSLKEDLSNKITKFYASSQGETHLADSDNGKIMDMMLYGKSEQKQYSGKNLFTFSNGSIDINGVIFEAKDGIITAKGTSTKEFTSTYFQFNYPKDIFTIGETYTFSLNSNDANLYLYALYKKNDMTDYKQLFGMTTKCATVKIPDNVDLIIRCVVRINTTVNATATIQIEKGSTATSYEPYVGGQPSPSPDYPQEIKSVVNPTVKIVGKNLLNPTLQTTTRNGVTCTANGDGTYTLNGTATTITTFDIAQDVSCSSFRLVGCPVGGVHDASYELQARTNNLIYGYDTGDGKNIKADENFFIRIRINAGTTCNNLIFKPMIVDAEKYPDATYDDFQPYREQTVTLPYTLNAIPVSSGGNVTIGGQQYIADYVDVERGKLVRCVKKLFLKQYQWSKAINKGVLRFYASTIDAVGIDGAKVIKTFFSISSHFAFVTSEPDRIGTFTANADGTNANIGFAFSTDTTTSSDDFNNWILNNKPFVFLPVLKEELPLTSEQTQALKELATYYPVTNISVNSEQLDGLTVFNYPISLANGWNYVKQQLNDNRDYIYDMDFQSAEAYVNSEYAVALTELEV